MSVIGPIYEPPLVRRTLIDGQLREFLHPVDGGPASERPVGAGEAEQEQPEGVQRPDPAGQLVWLRVTPQHRELPLHLPLFRAACDASGACCGLHHHVPVTATERAVICAVLGPDWHAPAPLEVLVHRAFDSGADGSFNIASVDGSCAFHRRDGLCELHIRGGPMVKPMACRSFPSNLVLCDQEWHASLRPECACIQRTAIEGVELRLDADSWVALRSHQDWVASVPAELRLDAQRTISRPRYLSWMRDLTAELRTSFEPIAELRRAAGLLASGDDEPTASPEARPKQQWLDGVVGWLQHRVDNLGAAWSDDSPYALGLRWALQVAGEVAADPRVDQPAWSAGRSRDWSRRQASLAGLFVHGHGLLEQRALVAAADDLGHFCWLARASLAVRPAAELDPRLESATLWLFLWRTLDATTGDSPLAP